MFNVEEIRQESILHSETPTDWTPEATLKEYLWATRSLITKPLDNNRFHAVSKHLILLIEENQPDLGEIKVLRDLEILRVEHDKCCKYIGYSHTKRNQYLRKIEGYLGIKTPIADCFL